MRRRSKRRGRPKGPKKILFPLRLLPEQKRDLQILSQISDGTPPLNGLIQDAIDQYLARKIADPRIRAEYDVRLTPRLKVIS